MNITPAVQGYADIVARHVQEGWKPYLVTVHFDALPGSKTAVRDQMQKEIEAAYARLVTRVVRKPNALSQVRRLPIGLFCPDMPVFKHEKQALAVVAKNDGEHVQGVVVMPPWGRSAWELDQHFVLYQRLYVRPDNKLALIHAKPITHDIETVIDYVTKSIKRGLVHPDHVLLLPRTRSEILNIGKPVGRQASIFAG